MGCFYTVFESYILQNSFGHGTLVAILQVNNPKGDFMANTEKYTDKDNQNLNVPGKEKENLIDTDNDGKYRTKGDTSDHGDPRSPYGKKQNENKDAEEAEEVEEQFFRLIQIPKDWE